MDARERPRSVREGIAVLRRRRRALWPGRSTSELAYLVFTMVLLAGGLTLIDHQNSGEVIFGVVAVGLALLGMAVGTGDRSVATGPEATSHTSRSAVLPYPTGGLGHLGRDGGPRASRLSWTLDGSTCLGNNPASLSDNRWDSRAGPWR